VLGFPASEIAFLVVWIAGAGILVGVLAGLFGIGGGSVIVPVLYEVFRVLGVPEDVRMQLCIGTSLAIIVPTTIRSYLAHRERGAVMPEVLRIWMAPMVIGVGIGSVLAAFAPQAVFKIVFVLLAWLIAARLLFGGDKWRLGDDLPGTPGMVAYGLGIGLAGSLMGVSGGSMSTIVLTLYGKSIHAAVGTAAGLGVPLTIAGTIGYIIAGWPDQAQLPPFSIGFVSLIGFLLMAPVSSFVAIFGVKVAHALPRRQLEIAFGAFLFLVSIRFIVSLF